MRPLPFVGLCVHAPTGPVTVQRGALIWTPKNIHQQVLLPLLSHPEFADGTLHIIAEPDFCFREADAVARAEWAKSCISESLILERLRLLHEESDSPAKLKAVIAEIYEAQRKLVSGVVSTNKRGWEKLIVEKKHFGLESSSSSSSRKRPASASSGGRLEIELRPSEAAVEQANFDVPPRGSVMEGSSGGDMGSHWLPKDDKFSKPATYGQPSKELSDLLDLAAAAARAGCGDFIWCSWNSQHWNEKGSGRKQHPFAGAFLQMLTTRGAKHISNKLVSEKTPDKHMGNWFRNEVCESYIDDPTGQNYGACYIYPSIGSYIAHESTTSRGRFLMSHWKQSWNQEGVRKLREDDLDRELCKVCKKGPRQTLAKVELPLKGWEAWWKTIIPNELPDIHQNIRPLHMQNEPGAEDPTPNKRWSGEEGVQREYKERIAALTAAAPWHTALQIQVNQESSHQNFYNAQRRQERSLASHWAHRVFVKNTRITPGDVYGQVPQILLPPKSTPDFIAHGFHLKFNAVEAQWLETCRSRFGPTFNASNQVAITTGADEIRKLAKAYGMGAPKPMEPKNKPMPTSAHPLIHDFKCAVIGRAQRNTQLLSPPRELRGISMSQAAKAGAKPKHHGETQTYLPQSTSSSSSSVAAKKMPRSN